VSDCPIRRNRRSLEECARSGASTASGSLKIVAASSKETSCFERFAAAFVGSQSNTLQYIHNDRRASPKPNRLTSDWIKSTETRRLTKAVRDAAPDLYFHVSSYGGAGFGFLLDLKNRGTTTAPRRSAFVPGQLTTCWQAETLTPWVYRGFK
jgi:hypothetical protein